MCSAELRATRANCSMRGGHRRILSLAVQLRARCVGDQVSIKVVGSASGKEINLALLAKATTSR